MIAHCRQLYTQLVHRPQWMVSLSTGSHTTSTGLTPVVPLVVVVVVVVVVLVVVVV